MSKSQWYLTSMEIISRIVVSRKENSIADQRIAANEAYPFDTTNKYAKREWQRALADAGLITGTALERFRDKEKRERRELDRGLLP